MLIEKNVPLPPVNRRGPRVGRSKTENIASLLQVGDSVLVPVKGKITSKTSTTVRNRFSYHGKKLGHTYAARVVDGGIRIWRTA
jgi:hypothetical protein